MCFSAGASFTAAAVLVPTGAFSIYSAFRADPRYVPIGTLPLLFGVQQLMEGLVWTSGARGDVALAHGFSLAYMFFAWLAWPVWVPFSVYFLESARRKPFYLVAAILGGIFGAGQYLPYFVHGDWLTVQFLGSAIRYDGVELFDYIFSRNLTYAVYLGLVILPALLSSRREVRLFGVLIALAFAITYAFFRYAYISVFCFLGAIVSLYLLFMIRRLRRYPPTENRWDGAALRTDAAN